MGTLLAREAILVALAGLFSMYLVPVLLGKEPALALLWVGLIMGLTFMALYAMAVLGGNRMPRKARNWIGLFAWVGAFANDFVLYAGLSRLSQATITPAAIYMILAPGLIGLVLAALGALKARPAERLDGALQALFAYSFPMLGVRWLLVPLVQVNPVAQAITVQAGALYVGLRVLLGTFWPTVVDGNTAAPALVNRPVPDAIVGLVEGTSRRSARPFAEGDPRAISVLVPADQVEQVVAKVRTALGERPFTVAPGSAVKGEVEVVVRPRD